jgi:hypothetical protein
MLAPNTTPPSVEQDCIELAKRIRSEHKAAQTAMCHAVAHALKVGDLLIQAKAAVPSGTWHRWLRTHCELSKRTALRYVQLAQHRAEIEHKIAGEQHLSVRAAQRLISKPKSETTSPGNHTDYEKRIEREDQNQAQATAAAKLADTLTKALRHALSLQQSEKSPTNALNGLLAKLGSNKLDLHDIEIVIRQRPSARPRGRRRAA